MLDAEGPRGHIRAGAPAPVQLPGRSDNDLLHQLRAAQVPHILLLLISQLHFTPLAWLTALVSSTPTSSTSSCLHA